jgi:hypothetical protein
MNLGRILTLLLVVLCLLAVGVYLVHLHHGIGLR